MIETLGIRISEICFETVFQIGKIEIEENRFWSKIENSRKFEIRSNGFWSKIENMRTIKI